MNYMKFILAVVATVISGIVVAMTGDSVISNVEWVNISIAGVGACAVFAAPNVPGAMYTKSILAALTAALTLMTSFITDGVSTSEWLQIGVAVLGALGVYAVPNSTQEAMSASKTSARGFAAIALTITLTITSGTVLLTAPVTMPACGSQQDVAAALRDADSGAQSFLTYARGTYPQADPRLKRIELFAKHVHTVAVEYPTLTDAAGQLKLLPTLNLALNMFQTEILPLMNLSPTQRLIALGIDMALRIAANRFVTTAEQLIAKSAAALDAQPGRKARAAVTEANIQTDVDVDAELAKVKKLLTKRLRCRDSISGKFRKMEVCKAKPATTTVETY